jgi:hypothetical protein
VRFFREAVDATPERRSAEMPVAGPYGSLHPGGKDTPLPGRRRYPGVKNLPWRSWLLSKRPGVKRRKPAKLQALMS